MKALVLGVIAAWGLATCPAAAAACAGFVDVDSADPFCGNVEWIRNRAITLGCTSTSVFCPGNVVTRLQMAAFLNRFGTALTPQQLVVEGALRLQDLDLDATPVACNTSTQFAVSGYPRRALVDLSLSAQAGTSLDVTAMPVASFDNGGTWIPLVTTAGRGSVTAGQWGHVSAVAVGDLNVGDNVRFGVRLGRAGGSGDLAGGACQLRVQVVGRDVTPSPL